MSRERDPAACEGHAAPGVSVVVLSHNRARLLGRTLASVFAQDLPGFEVLVVDNASSEGALDAVAARFPAARILRLPQNAGIGGRNLGFRETRSELVLSLDDDIELLDRGALRRIRERFARDPGLGALSLMICDDPEQGCAPAHWWHPVPRERFQTREFPTDHLNEAAVAFRSEALRRAGYYYESLFWGAEEWDLSLALMDAGYELRYFPEPVLHLAPRGSLNRRADPRHALLVRNRCWIALRRLPLRAALGFALPRLALWGCRSLRYGYFADYLRGVAGLVGALPDIVRHRKRISPETWSRVRALRRHQPDSLRA
jgi:hypothetical protein